MERVDIMEEVHKTSKANNWEERIEHKINMLFDEILDLRGEFENIRDRFFEDKIKKEQKELECELENKIKILQNIDTNYNRHFSLKCEKKDIFNGIKER